MRRAEMAIIAGAAPAPERPGAWQRIVLRWGMLLTLVEPEAADWARQEALRWLAEEERRRTRNGLF
jgi:hypothetical protein